MSRLAKFVIILLMVGYATELVLSATIEGTVYNNSTDELRNVRVEINTTPKQVYISKNATYKFKVPSGDYEINATYKSGGEKEFAIEQIVVKDNDNYVLDIMLLPVNEDELLNKSAEEGYAFLDNFTYDNNLVLAVISISAIVLLLIIGVVFAIKTQSNFKDGGENTADNKLHRIEDDNELSIILKTVREEGGRITQKELRKKLPHSESKISLMISELESRGAIKKIKKGRSNIIIIN